MTVFTAVLLGAAAVGVALAVLWPVLGADSADSPPGPAAEGEFEAVDAELEQTLRAIKEIAFDRESGHLSDADFEALDREERARAIELMRRRDAMTESSTRDADADGEVGVPGSRFQP